MQAIYWWSRALIWHDESHPDQEAPRDVAWAELVVGFELTTGLEVPAFRRPRHSTASSSDEPLSLSDKARVLGRMVRDAAKTLGFSIAPAQDVTKTTALHIFGMPTVAGLAAFAGLPAALVATSTRADDVCARARTTRSTSAASLSAIGGDMVGACVTCALASRTPRKRSPCGPRWASGARNAGSFRFIRPRPR